MGIFETLPESSYLKKLLLGEDPVFVERFLNVKQKFETAVDKEDKRILKDQFTGLFWDLYSRIAPKVGPNLSNAKRLFLRYGLADLRYLTPEDQKFILEQPLTPVDYSNETIFFVDEWLQGIAEGHIKASATDETENKTKSAPVLPGQMSAKREKAESLMHVEKERYNRFFLERRECINRLADIAEHLHELSKDEELGIEGMFSPEQVKMVDDLSAIQKDIRRFHKDMTASVRVIAKAHEQIKDALAEEEPASGGIAFSVGAEIINREVQAVRQMAKMTVGRQGNQFPFLSSSVMPKESRDYLFRDIVKKKLQHWLELDPEAFNRTYKGETLNIPPYIILVPGYGTIGACWEPLDSNNKQFGRGRITLPIFTRMPDVSILSAIGDLRWQAAKEIASYYWMEEGLTGRYYEYYLSAKLKGDLRHLFINDYLLWMTKETQGVQKLEKDARFVFWRYVPLPDEKKIWLSKKGYYYNQLWENELTWRQGQANK